ncbi:MAG TPA: retropepsin-like aspartic protease [Silvibacterium sp.]|nr:retropepsin-like aspartic protease [Silvibacterium sp.]
MYGKKQIALLCLSCFSLLGWGQVGKDPIVLQGRREGKSLYVSVLINGKGPFWFAVDSGAYDSVIDPYVMAQTRLKSVAQGTVKGTGAGEVSVEHAEPLKMRLDDLVVPVADPLVIDLTNSNPSWMHGLVGAELFEAYVVEMNYDNNQFRIFRPDDFNKPPKAAALPLIVKNHRFFIDVTIDVNDQKTVTHTVRVDTGSEDSVNDEIVKESSQVRETTLGNGIGANFKGYSGVYKAVHLGPYTFKNVWGPGAPNPGIGMEMFRRFIVTFDVPHGKLYLEPNDHFDEPFPAPPKAN